MRAGVVNIRPSAQYFELHCRFYPLERRTGEKKRKCSYGYLTHEEAVDGSPLFQFAVHVDGAKNWQSPAQLCGGHVLSEQWPRRQRSVV